MLGYEEPERHEEPQPGECYCHLQQGQRLCQHCATEYEQLRAEEVYPLLGPWESVGLDMALSPLDVAAIEEAARERNPQQ